MMIICREDEAERLKSVLGEEILREGKQEQLDPLITKLARLVSQKTMSTMSINAKLTTIVVTDKVNYRGVVI